jgi:hypothetical protein
VLVGIVSGAPGCGQVGVPTTYTNVLYFKDWIKAQLDVSGGPGCRGVHGVHGNRQGRGGSRHRRGGRLVWLAQIPCLEGRQEPGLIIVCSARPLALLCARSRLAEALAGSLNSDARQPRLA